MITISYKTDLINFNFSPAARKNVNRLSIDELYKVQEYLEEECYGPFSANEINEFFENEFDFICENILYRDPADIA